MTNRSILLVTLHLMAAVVLWAPAVSCHESSKSVWTKPIPETTPAFGCVAIVTGYPEVPRLDLVVSRLLNQLMKDFHVDPESVHVFCQGKCGQLAQDFPFQFHDLNNTVDRYKYRGFIIAENYKLMFKELFETLPDLDHCFIIEDDLVLAPDAMSYMEAGVELMQNDPSIFTVSLYNDNAYPWCASDEKFFRRIDHFSGLGFIMSKKWYLDLVKDKWDEDKVWDDNLQTIMASNKMASIQPEVNRVIHTFQLAITSTKPTGSVGDRFLAQVVAYSESPEKPYLENLQKKHYDADIIQFVIHAKVIEDLYDVGFHKIGTPLIYLKCAEERPCLDKLMRDHNLNGAGLGHMVRGIYQGTVFLRVFGHLVLVVIENSPFYEYIPKEDLDTNKVFQEDAAEENSIKTETPAKDNEESSDVKLQGLVRLIQDNYVVTVAPAPSATTSNSQTSCNAACKARGKTCTKTGLWALNTDCDVLRKVVPSCTSCNKKAYHVLKAGATFITSQRVCTLAPILALNCHAENSNKDMRYICACE